MLKLEVAQLSRKGSKRDHNEDCLGTFRPVEPEQRERQGDLFLVADGLGGHLGGEEASQYVVDRVIYEYAHYTGSQVRTVLDKAVNQANSDLYSQNQAIAAAQGQGKMGTTLIGAVVRGRELHVINVGDSRAYLLRRGKLEQISRDHSLVAQQVEDGFISPKQARHHVHRSTITRAVGPAPTVEVDYFRRTLRPGDTILLCTDGLSGELTDQQIASHLAAYPPQEAAQRLVGQVRQQGGTDDASLIIVRTVGAAGTRLVPPNWLGWLGLAAGAGLGVCLLTWLLYTLLGDRGLPDQPPQIGPVLYVPSPGETIQQVASRFGYEDAEQLPGGVSQPPAEAWGSGTPLSLQPRRSGVYMVGTVHGYRDGSPFELRSGGERYTVTLAPEGDLRSEGQPHNGNLVTVFGYLQDDNRLEAVLVDTRRFSLSQANYRWQNWYSHYSSGQSVWIYTVISPYTCCTEYGIDNGNSGMVAVWGTWKLDEGVYKLFPAEVYRLEGGQYVRVSPPQPSPIPTVTLIPTPG